MISRRIQGAILLLALVFTCAAQTGDDLQQTSNRLASSILLGPAMSTLAELSDGIGPRLTGSANYQAAAEWSAAKFGSYGLTNVHLEPFTIPNGWQRGTTRGEMLSPKVRMLHVETVGWTPATPPGGIEGEVAIIDDFTPEHIQKSAAMIKGRILLFDTAKLFAQGYDKALPILYASYAHLKDAGAVAFIFADREKNNVINAHDATWGAKLDPLPTVELGMEDSQLVHRLIDERQTVRIKFEVDNKSFGPTTVNNVIAEIRGREMPDQWILIGAHLDSWDFGTGAQDNGTGAVSVMEAARAIAAMGRPPRRSIRFALWGGEEQGILGSYAYTQAHSAELKNCVAVLNTDNGAGHPKGWKVEGRRDVADAMTPISKSLLKDLSGDDVSMEITYDTDHGPFMLQGIPVLDLEVDMTHYFDIHHKSSDTLDKVDPLDFKDGAAIVGVTAYALADLPNPIAPRIDHAAVGEIIKKAGMDQLLENVGVWRP